MTMRQLVAVMNVHRPARKVAAIARLLCYQFRRNHDSPMINYATGARATNKSASTRRSIEGILNRDESTK